MARRHALTRQNVLTSLDNYSLDDRYANDEGRVFLTGIQALARVPMEQLRIDAARGLNTAVFLSGYQGSPLGGFDQEMARAVKRVPDLDIVCKPGVNEELAATAVMGSQVAPTLEGSRYDGVIGYWYGKAPGIDRASDALRHAVYAGSHPLGGAVALVGDDPACKSSTLPSSSDLTMMNLKMPVLYPGDVQDVLDLGRHAVALARFSGLWVGFKIVTAVADGSGTVDLSLDRITPVIPDDAIDGNPRSFRPSANLIAPFTNERERDINEAGLVLARRYSEANNLNRVVNNPTSPWLGLVATGYTYRELLQALRRLGFDGLDELADAGVRVLRLDMPFPLAPEPIRGFARGLQTVMVIEEKGPSLEWMIKDVLYDMVDRPAMVTTDAEGRPLFPRHGFLTADQMVGGLRSVMATRLGDRLAPKPPKPKEKVLIPLSTQRSPYFCSGCPHNWGTKVPEDTLVGAGIGCSGMALLMDGDTVGDITGITCHGGRGRSVDRHGAVPRRRPLHPESGRRNLLPLRSARHSGRHRGRSAHDLQAPLQRHRRHDRRPGSRGTGGCARNRSYRPGPRCHRSHHHNRRRQGLQRGRSAERSRRQARPGVGPHQDRRGSALPGRPPRGDTAGARPGLRRSDTTSAQAGSGGDAGLPGCGEPPHL